MNTEYPSLTTALHQHIVQAIASADGWIGFDRFMALALYTPGLGYYANDSTKFGLLPQSGSDFVTAPELSPLFGQTLAVQVAEALERTGTHEVWEFGAGSGALALQLLDTLGAAVQRYTIVDLSGSLRARQQTLLAAHEDKVRWIDALPEQFEGVIVGNEVLDAMPVQLLARHGGAQEGVGHERGVALGNAGSFIWADQPSVLRPPLEIEGPHDYLSEIHPQAEAFIHTLGDRLTRGAAFFIDYGFGESEYYHPQRYMGTVMCHRAHRSDDNPLVDVGLLGIHGAGHALQGADRHFASGRSAGALHPDLPRLAVVDAALHREWPADFSGHCRPLVHLGAGAQPGVF